MEHYGTELLLDIHGCDLADDSTDRLCDYFRKLCELIKMTRVGEPHVWIENSDVPHLKGKSGVQFIMTSNVVCHTLPLLGEVYVNIFSCKEFDPEAAKQFSIDFWKGESGTSTVVTRG